MNDISGRSYNNQLIPTTIKNTSNYFDILNTTIEELDDEIDDDEETVVMSNLSKMQHQCDNATVRTEDLTDDDTSIGDDVIPTSVRKVQYALFDSGATAHFLVERAPVINKRVATEPLKIKLPDGTVIKSTHQCNLNIPWLPAHITEAHTVPGLAHSSLISTKKFCDAGCRVTFDTDGCKVYYNKDLVLSGIRDERTDRKSVV